MFLRFYCGHEACDHQENPLDNVLIKTLANLSDVGRNSGWLFQSRFRCLPLDVETVGNQKS